MTENEFVISVYTREQALADGVLVDVTEIARSAGILVPTAFTAAAYGFVTTSWFQFDDLERADAVYMTLEDLMDTVRTRGAGPLDTVCFDVTQRDENTGARVVKRLKAVASPDDEGKPCLTVMGSDED